MGLTHFMLVCFIKHFQMAQCVKCFLNKHKEFIWSLHSTQRQKKTDSWGLSVNLYMCCGELLPSNNGKHMVTMKNNFQNNKMPYICTIREMCYFILMLLSCYPVCTKNQSKKICGALSHFYSSRLRLPISVSVKTNAHRDILTYTQTHSDIIALYLLC